MKDIDDDFRGTRVTGVSHCSRNYTFRREIVDRDHWKLRRHVRRFASIQRALGDQSDLSGIDSQHAILSYEIQAIVFNRYERDNISFSLGTWRTLSRIKPAGTPYCTPEKILPITNTRSFWLDAMHMFTPLQGLY